MSNKVNLFFWKIFIICLCLQHMVFNYILSDIAILKYSKEIILIILFLLFIFQHNFSDRISRSLTYALLFFVCSFIISVIFSNVSAFVFVFRKYLIPIACCFLISNSFSLKNPESSLNLLKFLVKIVTVLSIWGIIQVLFLGDRFLINLGYSTVYDHLDYTFYFGNNYFIQRNCSTFASPNICAAVNVITILLGIVYKDKLFKKNRNFFLVQGILFCSLFLTFSRSNILALFFALLFYFHKKANLSVFIKYLLLIGLGLILVVLIVGYLVNNNFFETILSWIIQTLTGKESSSAGRTEIWQDALKGIFAHPLGVGLGEVGINGVQLFADTEKIYACENSFFAIALDCGILGLILYLGFYYYSFLHGKRKNSSIILNQVITVSLSIMFLFSNHIYDLEIICIAYIAMSASKYTYLAHKSEVKKAKVKYEALSCANGNV